MSARLSPSCLPGEFQKRRRTNKVEQMRLSEIAGAVGSSVSFDAPVRSVVTDSRKACAGTVFVAIRGEALDGNDFDADAIANGA